MNRSSPYAVYIRHRTYPCDGSGRKGKREYHPRDRKRQPTRINANPVGGFLRPRQANAATSFAHELIRKLSSYK